MSPVSVTLKYIKVPLLLHMCQLGILVSLYCDILLVFGSVLKLTRNLVFDFGLCGVLKGKACFVAWAEELICGRSFSELHSMRLLYCCTILKLCSFHS